MSALAIHHPKSLPRTEPEAVAPVKDETVDSAVLAVYLCDVWGWTQRRAAARLGCSIPTVARYKAIGRERFAQRFGKGWLEVFRRIDRAVKPADDPDEQDPAPLPRGKRSDVMH